MIYTVEDLPDSDVHLWMVDGLRCRFFPRCAIHNDTRQVNGVIGSRRFTPEQIHYIRSRVWYRREGVRSKPSWGRYTTELALEFNCSETTIKKIVRRQTYRDLP